jgi:hypothetical protein
MGGCLPAANRCFQCPVSDPKISAPARRGWRYRAWSGWPPKAAWLAFQPNAFLSISAFVRADAIKIREAELI